MSDDYNRDDLWKDLDCTKFTPQELDTIGKNREYIYDLEQATGFPMRMYVTRQDEEFKEDFKDKFDIYVFDPNETSKVKNPMLLVKSVDDFTNTIDDKEIRTLIEENGNYNNSKVSKEFNETFTKYEQAKELADTLQNQLASKQETKPKQKFKI